MKTQLLFAPMACLILFAGCRPAENGTTPTSDQSAPPSTQTVEPSTTANNISKPNQQQGLQGPVAQPLPSKGTVIFDEAGISFVPGDEWQRLKTGPLTDVQSICLPALKGEGKFSGSAIQVFSTLVTSDAKSAADILHEKLKSQENVKKDSFQQEDFTSVSEVHGFRVSYEYLSKSERHDKNLKAHVYLFQNKKGKCVTINYVTLIEKNSDVIDQMIRDTLRLN